MREESHLDEMRTAIRGDFERLAERRGEQELMRVAEPESLSAAAFPEPDPQLETDPGPKEEREDEAAPRSWLQRFFSP